MPRSWTERFQTLLRVLGVIDDDQGHPLRQKFSLGHELGHWVNDRGKNLTYRCTTDDMRSRWSRTSMAIRFVDKNDFPYMLICWHKSGARKLFTSNSTIPENIWPHKYVLNPSTVLSQSDGVEVDTDKWISGEYPENHTVIESVFNKNFDWFTLICWVDESQLTTY